FVDGGEPISRENHDARQHDVYCDEFEQGDVRTLYSGFGDPDRKVDRTKQKMQRHNAYKICNSVRSSTLLDHYPKDHHDCRDYQWPLQYFFHRLNKPPTTGDV